MLVAHRSSSDEVAEEEEKKSWYTDQPRLATTTKNAKPLRALLPNLICYAINEICIVLLPLLLLFFFLHYHQLLDAFKFRLLSFIVQTFEMKMFKMEIRWHGSSLIDCEIYRSICCFLHPLNIKKNPSQFIFFKTCIICLFVRLLVHFSI